MKKYLVILLLVNFFLPGVCYAGGKKDSKPELRENILSSDLIICGVMKVPVSKIKADIKTKNGQYVQIPVKVTKILHGQYSGNEIIFDYYEDESDGFLAAGNMIKLNGKKVILYLVKTGSDGKVKYYLTRDSKMTVEMYSDALEKQIEKEAALQDEILKNFPANTAVVKYDKEVVEIIKRIMNKNTENQAFSELEKLGCEAVPAIVKHMDDKRELPVKSIQLKNSWELMKEVDESFRIYGPETVCDALAAILNQITGYSFGDLYNGASDAERDAAVAKWRVYAIYPVFIKNCIDDKNDFSYTEKNGKISIENYKGTGGDIFFPDMIDGKPVISIESTVFFQSNKIISIFIPAGIVSIGKGAFTSFSKPVKISVSADNKNYADIDGVLFSKNKKILIQYPGGKNPDEYIIPEGVTSIGYAAFKNADRLKSITIPRSVKSIGNYAFWGCSNLTGIIVPATVTSIGENTFSNCKGLTNITIPDSVTSIGKDAFVFCTGLKSITIPSGVNFMADYPFMSCPNLENITVSAGNKNYSDIDGVLFSKDKKILIKYPEGKRAGTYIIPESVTAIGGYAFSGINGLSGITIHRGVTSIGDGILSGSTPSLGFSNPVISGYKNSYAEIYSKKENINFKPLD